MPIKEVTGERPSNFSKWHRNKLPEWCLMTDGDYFMQVKVGEKVCVVAYVEEIDVDNVEDAMLGGYPVWPSKDALCREIMEKMNIPSFILYHNPQCTDFLVFSYADKTYRRMTEDEYMSFEVNLRRAKL
jgi:hypothetical protein